MTTVLIDVVRFAALLGRSPDDGAVVFAVELAEDLVVAEVGEANAGRPGVGPIAFSVAARLLAAPPSVTQESAGQLSTTYAAGAGTIYLAPEERAALRRVQGRGPLGSIALVSHSARRR